MKSVLLAAVVAVAQAGTASFEAWKSTHGKSYATLAEENLRLSIFERNLAVIDAHNAKKDRSWSIAWAHTVHALATASVHSSHCGVCTVCAAGRWA